MSPHDQQCWKTVSLSNYCVTSHKLLSKYFVKNSDWDSNFVFNDGSSATSCLFMVVLFAFFRQTDLLLLSMMTTNISLKGSQCLHMPH